MTKRIKYTEGQILGPYGAKYIKEAPPDKDKKNSNKNIRKAEFECGFCQKHFVARINNIKNGHTKSCGCKNLESNIKAIREYNKLGLPPWNKKIYKTGDTVGDYGVIFLEDIDDKSSGHRKAKFTCPICGMTFEAIVENVTRNLTKGCGNHMSHGEERIAKVLRELGISFEIQKSFENLLSQKGWKYRFDFYLPDYNLLIEYDGIQHFEYKDGTSGWNNKENFLLTRQRDLDKDDYCIKNKIHLIRIPYTEFSKINKENIYKMIIGDDSCEICFNKVF